VSRDLLDVDKIHVYKVPCTYRECLNPALAVVLPDTEEDEDENKVGFLCYSHLNLMREDPEGFSRIGFEFRERYEDEFEDV
jgi:hypothetical protein